ncbi:glycosyltransferase family 61 protein [Gemmobacter serpentinus]|uniref:glycosyltransferase family 61 protein n=1 Tax=Gemmobacter serpentinus TaxID=2652247 RepID=UPI00186578BF|nr:glycosyltransferase family 61 protein [Gemmobacter serpentinus]
MNDTSMDNIKSAKDLVGDIEYISDTESPDSYQSFPPAFCNLEDVPPGKWRSLLEKTLGRDVATLPKGEIYRARNASMVGNGFLVTESGIQIADTLPNGKPIEITEPAVQVVEDFAVLLRKHGDSNFGHWLVEICTRIPHFRRAFPLEQWKVIVPSRPLSMRNLRQTTLEWMGIDKDRIIWAENEHTLLSDVAFMTVNSIHSHTHDPLGVSEFRREALSHVETGGHRRLYVSRDNSMRRRLLNEADVLSKLAEFGFEIVSPEAFPIEQQAQIFSSAQVVIGVSGAAMTNILFAPSSCKVLSFNPDSAPEFFFWDLANIVGQEFSFIFGPASDPHLLSHSDFTVDINALDRWLRERCINP